MVTSGSASSPKPAADSVNAVQGSGVLDALAAGVVLLDQNLRILYLNGAASSLLGPCVDLATVLSGCVVDQHGFDWGEEFRAALKDPSPRRIERVRIVDLQGAQHDLSVSIRRTGAVPDDHGGLAVVLEDITDLLQLKERVRTAEDMAAVGRLAARVAHELNNPLDGAMRYLGLCQRKLEGDATAHADALRYLDQARQGLMRMAGIVADLLAFSRNTPMIRENGNINSIVDEAIRSLSDHADRHGVVVAAGFRDDDRMPSLAGTRLYQVCCNLVRNAIDAMPNGGCITVSTGLVESDVVVRFEDTGVGLPDDVERVFEPFYTTKPAGKGTGLGLAICRDYIAQLGGTITASANEPNGAVFTIRIPLNSCGSEEGSKRNE